VAQGKGSVRSTPGISAVGGLRAASAWLTRWGGHAAAAGFALDEANFEPFRDAVYDFVSSHEAPRRTVTADALLRPDQVTSDLHAALAALEPYGQGHAAPCFAVHGPLTHLRAVGKAGDHLQLAIGEVRGVAWNLGHEADRWALGATVTAFAGLTEATFRDRTTIELRAQSLTDAHLRLERDAAADATVAPAERAPDAPRRRGTLRIGPPLAGPASGLRHVTSLALRPLDPLGALRDALASGDVVHLDLDATALAELARAAAEYPDVHDVRLAFVETRRGRSWPWTGQKADLVRAILTELDLVDERGRARRGERRDPYDAPTLRGSLVARHALDTLVNVVAALPPDDAALAVSALLGEPSDRAAGEAAAERPTHVA
jgi:hypothetical protein